MATCSPEVLFKCFPFYQNHIIHHHHHLRHNRVEPPVSMDKQIYKYLYIYAIDRIQAPFLVDMLYDVVAILPWCRAYRKSVCVRTKRMVLCMMYIRSHPKSKSKSKGTANCKNDVYLAFTFHIARIYLRHINHTKLYGPHFHPTYMPIHFCSKTRSGTSSCCLGKPTRWTKLAGIPTTTTTHGVCRAKHVTGTRSYLRTHRRYFAHATG